MVVCMRERFRMYFRLATTCVWLNAAALFSIQIFDLIENETAERVCSYLAAVVFWGSLAVELISLWMTNTCRSKLEQQYGSEICKHQKPGYIAFMKSPRGRVADIAWIASFAVLLLLTVLQIYGGWLLMTVLSVFWLSLQLHCFYNGRNYCFLTALNNMNKEKKYDES